MRFALVLLMTAFLLPQNAEARAPGLDWVNALRAQHGLQPLRHSPRLDRAASVHARDMHSRGFFSHTGSDGSNVGRRARRAGYRYCSIRENIARGYHGLNTVLTGWRNSPGHYKNMVDRKVTEYGLVQAPGGIWVMVLGRPGC